jgi:D-sedoheptulose 7-phosphate isomerase
MTDIHHFVTTYLDSASRLIVALPSEQVAAAVDMLFDAWQRRSLVYVCGNGGSGAIASHFAGDLNKGANIEGRHRFRAIALVDNVPALMAWSNDEGYDVAMAEQLRNFVEPGDLVIGISGSGNSANVLQAMALAGQAGAQRLAFVGFDGGQLVQPIFSDVTVHVPSTSMEQVEDAFSVICHCLLYALRHRIRQAPLSDTPLLASAVDAYQE